jgi:hypothetical protein
MATPVNDQRIELPCPGCGNPMSQTIGWLRSHDVIDCAACGMTINLGSDFRTQLEALAEEAGGGRPKFKGLTISLKG